MSEPWQLKFSSFKGVAPGATHVYGVLVAPFDRRWKLQKVLTAADAKLINEVNERFGRDHMTDWEAGQHCEQWASGDDLRAHARTAFRFLTPPGTVLLGDDVLNPADPVDGPEEVVSRLRAVWQFAEDSTGGSSTAAYSNAAYDRWETLVTELGWSGIRHTAFGDEMRVAVEHNPEWENKRSPAGYDATVTLEVF